MIDLRAGHRRVRIAVDPGTTGAVGALFLGPWPAGTEQVRVWDTPTNRICVGTRTVKAGKNIGQRVPKYRTVYDLAALRRILMPLVPLEGEAFDCQSAVETTQVRPGEMRGSAMLIGMGFGLWIGAFGMLEIPTTPAFAATWKPQIFRGTGLVAPSIPKELKEKEREKAQRERDHALKENSRELARRYWPAQAELFARQMDHGRSDALLLAAWLDQKLQGLWHNGAPNEKALDELPIQFEP